MPHLKKRMQILKNRSVSIEHKIDPERAIIVTEAYQHTEGEHPTIRRAKVLNHLLSNKTINIAEGELIVGEKTKKPGDSPLYPELYCPTIKELESISEREKQAPFHLTKKTKKLIKDEVLPYWSSNQTMYSRIMNIMTSEWKQALDEGIFTEYMLSRAPGHVNLDGKILEKGLQGLKEDISYSLRQIDYTDPECYNKICQLKAMVITCDAAIHFAKRYAEKAKNLAKKEENPKRKKELKKIALICSRVPAHPAETFYEALQSLWFIHLIITLELNNWATGPGRFDQYLFPYYKNDLEKGRITKQEAKELLQCLWIKFNNTVAPAKELKTANMSATYNDFPLLSLGGVDKEGNNAVNELSYLVLDVIDEMRLIQPNPAVLISDKTPDDFLIKACEVIGEGFGQPSVFNMDLIVQELLNKGKSLKDARLGAPNGCVTVNACGKENMASTGYLNWPKIIELVLNNGMNPATGSQLGPKTGDPRKFNSFEKFIGAYRQQLEHFITMKINANHLIDRMYARHMPAPFLSLLIDDCIKTGVDFHAGGARYNMSYIQGVGLGTASDSLAAIKKLVFEDKNLSMEELLEALNKNFENCEDIRQMLLNQVPKYGNDDDYVDKIMKKLVDIYVDTIDGKANARGGEYGINLLPTTVHIYFGSVCGATPDGRKKGEPLSEGISPVQGRDIKGPTAVVRSCAKMDQGRLCGTLLNQKFTANALDSVENIRKFASLVKTYFSLGGHHIQFNIISADVLREAKQNPQKYQNLIVRVAGYSDYFVNLNESLQNEIIRRTEQKIT